MVLDGFINNKKISPDGNFTFVPGDYAMEQQTALLNAKQDGVFDNLSKKRLIEMDLENKKRIDEYNKINKLKINHISLLKG
jgi:hypothetical protein